MVVSGHIRAVERSPAASEDACAVTAELSAMQQIAAALEGLDEATRARVLQWAAQRFQVELSSARPQAPEPLPAARHAGPSVDEALSVSTLEDLFGSSVPGPPAPAAPADPPARPVTGMLREFVVEFQSIAREWSDASDTPSDKAGGQRASSDV